ncbi:hypothetical protein BN2476_320032 [Paraburkholderia piptadeniae]|uniref:Uncharacterized protein n=1 Tax=Paraburkholderia piptadeniae TaxID=1701573 RepID=A0A1N7S4E9_9BURK|nr:hypothetical protein [Paraburkholderia piptadeniae]SIT42283.1 hypothetical protein BN2476_320032 [Paraburkholderia piptadeniae]
MRHAYNGTFAAAFVNVPEHWRAESAQAVRKESMATGALFEPALRPCAHTVLLEQAADLLAHSLLSLAQHNRGCASNRHLQARFWCVGTYLEQAAMRLANVFLMRGSTEAPVV